jgi:hypothetical protein
MIGSWLKQGWKARQRAIDLRILWPACKQEAAAKGLTLDHAKAAFARHAFHDPAWQVLGEPEIMRRIDELA